METSSEEISIASNTPEQSHGDVLMIEPKKDITETIHHQTISSSITQLHQSENDNKLLLKTKTSREKSLNKIDNDENINLQIDIKKSPIKDEQENCSQQSLLISDNLILSPPKSEPQSTIIAHNADDDIDGSPLSHTESQLSPILGVSQTVDNKSLNRKLTPERKEYKKEIPAKSAPISLLAVSQPILKITPTACTKKTSSSSSAGTAASSVRLVTNGVIPKSGKPLMAAINKKLNKPRGRPKAKTKTIVAMYQSEISDNTGIKLCIKKSDQITPTKTVKQNRKRSRKSKNLSLDSDDSDYEKRRRKEKSNNNRQTDKNNKKTNRNIDKEPIEQSHWGNALPSNVLYKIFQNLVQQDGCIPALFRLGRVCSHWREISLSPSLWSNLDLSTWIKDKHRTELRLKWLIENRFQGCKDLNISTWKVTDVQCVLNKLLIACPGLVGITLAGWKGFYSDHLTFLTEEFKKLQRIDLSSINIEVNPNKTAVGLQSLCNAIQTINGRLTHLHLADNRLAGIPQIVSTLATHCPNLVLLDLSNVRTVAVSHGILHVEKLQQGCQKLKVLRVTNSHITLNAASLSEQMESPGFPELEELSVASLSDESRLINDEFLQRILKNSTKLKLLDVRGCARLTHDSLIRLQAWDLKHLFLSGCSVTRDVGSGLELIASKWAHSLTEFDLAWANVQQPLDNAIKALAEKGPESPLTHLNLCGSSVSEEAVKEILINCPILNSINLSSCRGLPRGVKRLMHGPTELQELRDVLKVKLKIIKSNDIIKKTEEESN